MVMRLLQHFLLLLSGGGAAVVHAWTCYLPAGNEDTGGMVPCNATLADTDAGSACCDARDACTVSGMCLGPVGLTYRGGCTDSAFESDNCPSLCLEDPSSDAKYSRNANILACPQVPDGGVYTDTVCCQAFETAPDSSLPQSCCNSSFKYPGSGRAFMPGWDATLAMLALQNATIQAYQGNGTALARLNGTGSNGTTNGGGGGGAGNQGGSGGHNDALRVGLGVGLGLPLSLLALALGAWLLYREKHRTELARRRDGRAQDSTSAGGALGGAEDTEKIPISPLSAGEHQHSPFAAAFGGGHHGGGAGAGGGDAEKAAAILGTSMAATTTAAGGGAGGGSGAMSSSPPRRPTGPLSVASAGPPITIDTTTAGLLGAGGGGGAPTQPSPQELGDMRGDRVGERMSRLARYEVPG